MTIIHVWFLDAARDRKWAMAQYLSQVCTPIHQRNILIPDYRCHVLILPQLPRLEEKSPEFQNIKQTDQVTGSSSQKSTSSYNCCLTTESGAQVYKYSYFASCIGDSSLKYEFPAEPDAHLRFLSNACTHQGEIQAQV